MIGLDSGFFVLLADGHPEATRVWERLVEGDTQACVSCVSLLELERLGLKGALPDHDVLCEGIVAVCSIVWIDSSEMLSLAARLSHGLGVPLADALILAAFVSHGAKTIYTTDRHLEAYRKKGVEVINLRRDSRRNPDTR